MRRPVGKTSAPLYSYFALVADDPSVADRQPGADLVHQGSARRRTECEGPAAAFGGRSVQGGRPRRRRTTTPTCRRATIAIKNVADLYLYPNTVRAVAITGAQVKEWLEMSAGIFNQVEPGKADQTLINPTSRPTIST